MPLVFQNKLFFLLKTIETKNLFVGDVTHESQPVPGCIMHKLSPICTSWPSVFNQIYYHYVLSITIRAVYQ